MEGLNSKNNNKNIKGGGSQVFDASTESVWKICTFSSYEKILD